MFKIVKAQKRKKCWDGMGRNKLYFCFKTWKAYKQLNLNNPIAIACNIYMKIANR
jgi:hypothetical protein